MGKLNPAEFRARILALIERLKTAQGRDSALNRDILAAYVDREAGYLVEPERLPQAPDYTGDDFTVRDMMQLAGPNWWMLGGGKTRENEPLYGASVYRTKFGDMNPLGEGEHATSPGIAFCIAALNAWLVAVDAELARIAAAAAAAEKHATARI